MSKIIPFSQGPAVRITLQFSESQLQRTSLSLSQKFESEWIGEADEKIKAELLDFLENYSQRKAQTLSLSLPKLTPFRQKVLTTLQDVPFGSVVSYGELAELSGHLRAARAVGSTCNHNPFPLFIPCHRVIASDSKMGGFSFNTEIKKRLLDFESLI